MIKRFILAFFTFIFIPFVLYGMYFQSVFSGKIRKEFLEKAEKSYEQIVSIIEEEIKEESFILSRIGLDQELHALLLEYESSDDPGAKLFLQRAIEERLQFYIGFRPEVESVCFFFDDSKMYASSGSYRNEFAGNAVRNDSISDSAASFEALGNPGEIVIDENIYKLDSMGAFDPAISLLLSPSAAGGSRIKIISLTFRVPLFIQEHKRSELGSSDSLFILNGQGKNIFRSNEIKDRSSVPILSENVLVTDIKMRKTGWRFLWSIDVSALTSHLKKQLFWIKGMNLCAAVLLVLFLFYNYKAHIHPIEHLIKLMSRAGRGDTSLEIKPMGSKEIFRLFESLDIMLHQIEDLNRQKIKMELKSLQFQINPHFLANSMNSIRLMAMIDKNPNIKNMSESLIQILNSTFRTDSSYSDFRTQMSNIDSYMKIMNIRYGNEICLEYQIQEEILSLFVLKMLLQPLIENSIIHGLAGMEENRIIRISGRIAHMAGRDILELRVEDNGGKLSKRDFDFVINESGRQSPDRSQRKGIGLSNVINRIKFHYGSPYGVFHETIQDVKTVIVLILPVIEEQPDA